MRDLQRRIAGLEAEYRSSRHQECGRNMPPSQRTRHTLEDTRLGLKLQNLELLDDREDDGAQETEGERNLGL